MSQYAFLYASGVDSASTPMPSRGASAEDLLEWGVRLARRERAGFAFAVGSREGRLLVLGRDIVGACPLYVAEHDGRSVVGGTIEELLRRLPRRPVLDPTRIADALVYPMELSDGERTGFVGVRSVPAGHVVVVADGRRTLRRYWDPPYQILPDGATDEAFEEGYRDRLRAAVEPSLTGGDDTCVLMSGGVDSISVAATMAGLRSPVPAVSLLAPEGHQCPERPFVRAAAASLPIASHQVTPKETRALDEAILDFLGSADDPFAGRVFPMSISGLFWASRLGMTRVLTGLCGDLSTGSGGRAETEILQREGPQRGVSTILRLRGGGARDGWARLRLTKRAIALRLPPAVRRTRYAATREVHWRRARRASFIREDFARATGLEERWRDTHRRVWAPDCASDRDGHLNRLNEPILSRAMERYARAARFAGIGLRHPLLDRELLEFCVAAPLRQRVLGGATKSLLRRAMAGCVPKSVLERVDRRNPAAEFGRGYADRLFGPLEAGLGAYRAAMEPYVDVQRIATTLRRYRDTRSAHDADDLWSMFVLGAFLHRFG